MDLGKKFEKFVSMHNFAKKSHFLGFFNWLLCLPTPKNHMTLVMCAHMPRILVPVLHVQYQFIIGFWPSVSFNRWSYSIQMLWTTSHWCLELILTCSILASSSYNWTRWFWTFRILVKKLFRLFNFLIRLISMLNIKMWSFEFLEIK